MHQDLRWTAGVRCYDRCSACQRFEEYEPKPLWDTGREYQHIKATHQFGNQIRFSEKPDVIIQAQRIPEALKPGIVILILEYRPGDYEPDLVVTCSNGGKGGYQVFQALNWRNSADVTHNPGFGR